MSRQLETWEEHELERNIFMKHKQNKHIVKKITSHMVCLTVLHHAEPIPSNSEGNGPLCDLLLVCQHNSVCI